MKHPARFRGSKNEPRSQSTAASDSAVSHDRFHSNEAAKQGDPAKQTTNHWRRTQQSVHTGTEHLGSGSQTIFTFIDIAISFVAGLSCCTRLWEQDIWWQLRLGDDVLRGKPFPQFEEWSYTSSHVPFHNHWWLATVLFSAVYHTCGGIPGLVCLRGITCGVFFYLLLALRPHSMLRWPLAALVFCIVHYRLQARPETYCVLIFLSLFLLRRRVALRDAAARDQQRSIWPPEVLAMYALVVVAANTHFGVIPFVLLSAGVTLADGFLYIQTDQNSSASPSPASPHTDPPGPTTSSPSLPSSTSQSASIIPCLDIVPFLRGAALIFLPFINPQPLAGIAYIVHHSPVKYHQSKMLRNPEMQSLISDATALLESWSKSTPNTTYGYWLLAYVLLCVLVPIIWVATPRAKRPAGLTHRFTVLTAYVVLVALSIDRTRNLVWTTCFLAALLSEPASPAASEETTSLFNCRQFSFMRGVGTRNKNKSANLRQILAMFACLASTVGMLWIIRRPLSLQPATHNWPVRSAEFVRTHRPMGNVYHTITFGGFLVYGLQEYKIFADTREYCFAHLDEVYHVAHTNSFVLNNVILQGYNVNTLVSLIPETQQLPDGSYDAVIDRYLDRTKWARVFFDHVSEVFVKRNKEHAKLIDKYEIRFLNPALPPDLHARILLGREPGNKDGLQRELDTCLSRDHVELYCTLVRVMMRMGVGPSVLEARSLLKKIEDVGEQDMLNERKFVRGYAESTRRMLRSMLK